MSLNYERSLKLWLLSCIRSSSFLVKQKYFHLDIAQAFKLCNTSIFYHQLWSHNPSSGSLMWFSNKALMCQTHFFIKSCLSPHLSQGCAVCHPNGACPSVLSHLRDAVLTTAEPVNVTRGWLTAVCWFNATAYFLCFFVLMSAFSGISEWVSRLLFQGPLLTSVHRYHTRIPHSCFC